ncbi:MAG: hypothetical protein QXP60_05690 [Nitrososphaerota archaeon]
MNKFNKCKIRAYIQSFTDPNKKYIIRQMDNGDLMCSCPSWFYFKDPIEDNGIRKRSCKHIRSILNSDDPIKKMIFNSGKYIIDINGKKWEIRKEEKYED